jgi:hypothetical protein
MPSHTRYRVGVTESRTDTQPKRLRRKPDTIAALGDALTVSGCGFFTG